MNGRQSQSKCASRSMASGKSGLDQISLRFPQPFLFLRLSSYYLAIFPNSLPTLESLHSLTPTPTPSLPTPLLLGPWPASQVEPPREQGS